MLEEKENDDYLKLTTNQLIDKLPDGTEILRDELEEKEEEITDDNLRKLIEFTTGSKNLTDDDISSLRNDDSELERLIKISKIKSLNFTFSPKKNFNTSYKKNRKRKNRISKKSRAINK